MKVLIIGCQGMLGQELSVIWQSDSPILLDKNDLDIADQIQVGKVISMHKPDLVFNTAAYNDVDGAEKETDLAYNINGYGPGHIATALNESGGILVHYSTDYVFKGDQQAGYSVNDAPDPISAYGHSKLLGEKEVKKNMQKFYVIRLSRLFGKLGTGRTVKKSFIQLMIDLATAESFPESGLNIVNQESSNPTYAPDLAQASKALVTSSKPFGTYHITNKGACTWYEFAQEIFKIKGINVKINPVPSSYFKRKAARPKFSALNGPIIDSMRTWQEALQEYLNNTDGI